MRNNGPGHAAGLSFAIMLKLNRAMPLAGSPPHAKIRRNGRFIAMSISISRRTLAGLGLASLLPKAVSAQAAWPDRQVRLIVPFGAGGAVDTLSRLVANGFAAQANGQALVVENRSGAGGAIAGAFVAQSRPDGYTLMMADLGANCIGKELQPALNYDPMRAFTPISHLVNLPIAVIVPANLPVQSLEELLARARARADGIQYASPGVGHVSHLAAELLGRRAGVKLTAVHYRSGADVMRSLIQGETEFSFPSVSTALPFIREGRVRALAIGTPAPVAALPGVPAVAATFPGFEAMTWHGIVGPAGMPDDVVAAANRVFRAIITSAEVKETVQRVQAADVIASSPAEFAALIARDHAKWTPVIREGNIRAE
jgi:tripartite-type tricarboxylate transporter receptor subunit TctC